MQAEEMVASGNAAQLRQAAIAFGRALGFTTVRRRARPSKFDRRKLADPPASAGRGFLSRLDPIWA